MIQRFILAQGGDRYNPGYAEALAEIRAGKKQSHWIWYIFPQLKGLGHSIMARFYGIRDLEEAREYLADPLLGARLIEISNALLGLPGNDPEAVMSGWIDAAKLRSSMTLFAKADPECVVFQQVLEKYFQGEPDPVTLRMLQDRNS